MYIHNTRKIINDTIDVLLEFEKENIRPDTLIAYSRFNELTETLQFLINEISKTHPKETRILEKCLSHLIAKKETKGVLLNAYMLGEIIGIISVLDAIYTDCPKIFISHSSVDKEIVKAFKEKVLMLGCGFEKDDIFCTLDEDAIKLGTDFRKSIIDNMRCCDYIFLMISENYRKSEICHNEVGAAWALQDIKRVIPLKFPNLSFSQKDLGVLNVVKQAGSLNNKQQLIKIYEELCEVYDIQPHLSKFVQYAVEFIEIVNKQKSAAAKGTEAKEGNSPLLDSLSDFDKTHLVEWAHVDNGECWIIESMDGTFVELGKANYDISSGRVRAKWDAFFERMIKLGFAVVDRLNSDDSPIYKLKEAAYDYVDKMHT